MSKRVRIRAVSFLAAGAVVLLGVAVQGQVRAMQYRRQLTHQYELAFAELTQAVEQLDAALQKGSCVTSGALMVELCGDGFQQAQAAQAALGSIPYANVELEQTGAAIGKIGDYLFYLSGAVAEQQASSQEQRETLAGFSETTSALAQQLESVQADLNSGNLTLESLEEATKRLSGGEDGQVTAGSAYDDVEADLPELPGIIYDGPFSEHLTDRVPAMLDGLGEVTEETARQTAADALNLTPEQLTLVSEGEGELPSYGFSTSEKDGGYYIEVTRQGGKVSSFFRTAPEGEPTLSEEEAAGQAADYLARYAFGPMEATGWVSGGNTVSISFAAVQDGVLLYPDLVKVEVSLIDGKVVGLECAGYLANHTQRSFGAVQVTAEQAKAVAASSLSVQSVRLALIPTRGSYEVLCQELLCEMPDGSRCLIYVNAETGQEEQILLVMEDENGSLAR